MLSSREVFHNKYVSRVFLFDFVLFNSIDNINWVFFFLYIDTIYI